MAIEHSGSRTKTGGSPETDNGEMSLEQSPPNENAPETSQRFHIIVVENALNKEHQYLFSLGLFFLFNRSSFSILQSPGMLPGRQ